MVDLGQGSFGQVFVADTGDRGKRVVVKRINKRRPNSYNVTHDVESEVAVLLYLKDHCAEYFLCYEGAFEDADHYYIVTQFLADYLDLRTYMGPSGPWLSCFRIRTKQRP